jgi:hypothetical protein
MKIYKYVTMFLAFVAMSATFISCDRDNDITGNPFTDHGQEVDGKQDYWISFELTPGSLTQEEIAFYNATLAEQIYPDDYAAGTREIKFIEHPMYVTEDYARNNFNKVSALSNEENDIVQKVMIPTFCADTTGGRCPNDFTVTMTLSKDSMKTVLATHTWNAATAFDGPGMVAKNKQK